MGTEKVGKVHTILQIIIFHLFPSPNVSCSFSFSFTNTTLLYYTAI